MRDSLKYRLAIHQANSREEVVAAVRGYFNSLSAGETAALPAPLREVAEWGVEEVINVGMLMADAVETTSATDSDARILREVTSVITLAALRMSLLAMDDKKRAREGSSP